MVPMSFRASCRKTSDRCSPGASAVTTNSALDDGATASHPGVRPRATKPESRLRSGPTTVAVRVRPVESFSSHETVSASSGGLTPTTAFATFSFANRG